LLRQPGSPKPQPADPPVLAPARDPDALLLPINAITVTTNIRSELPDLESLADSIKQHGILQALVVSKSPGGFELVAGARRLKAAEMAGLTDVPVRVLGASAEEIGVLRLLENLARADLDGPDEIRAVAALLPQFGGNQTALASAIGKDRTYVNKCCRAAEVLADSGCATSHTLSKSLLFELAAAEDPHKLLDDIKSGAVKTVEDTRRGKAGKEPRARSGPIEGGRFVSDAFKMRERKNGVVNLKLNYCPDRTPERSKLAMLESLRRLVERLEQDLKNPRQEGGKS